MPGIRRANRFDRLERRIFDLRVRVKTPCDIFCCEYCAISLFGNGFVI